MAAQHDRLGLLGKHLAFHIAANQQNSNFFRNSAAATHAFWRHYHPTLNLTGNLHDGTWISPPKSLKFVDAGSAHASSKRPRPSSIPMPILGWDGCLEKSWAILRTCCRTASPLRGADFGTSRAAASCRLAAEPALLISAW